MKTFVATVAKGDFPTSEKRDETTVTVQKAVSEQRCDEFMFCTMADRCDGIHCLSGDSDR